MFNLPLLHDFKGDLIARLLGDWSSDVTNIGTIFLRLFLVVLCAGAIGLERSNKRHTAGLRTYLLVSLGATIIMMLNEFLHLRYGGDISRLGAQVVTGIGFIGAGTILVTSRNQIKGLTTAAGLWAAACMGLTIGAGFYTVSIVVAILILIILAFMPKLEKCIRRKSKYFELHVELETRQNLKELVNFLRSYDIHIDLIEKNRAYIESGLSVYTIMLTSPQHLTNKECVDLIRQLDYVNYCEQIKA